jgi:HEAT repeat protein
MGSFCELIAEIRRDCGCEHIPYKKISALARVCGAAEIESLIRELDALDDADLVDDAGDMSDEYWRLRTAYSQALAEIGGPAVEPLLCALASANPQTRAYAAKSLGLIGAPHAFEPIVGLLAREPVDSTRLSLIEALGELRDSRAVPILLEHLRAPEQANRGWTVRLAANALGTIGGEEVIGPLSEVLASDPDWFARLGAAEGLRKVRHPSAAKALRRALKDEDARVRAAASG